MIFFVFFSTRPGKQLATQQGFPRIGKPRAARCLLPPRTPPCFRPEAMMPTSIALRKLRGAFRHPPGRAQELPSSPQESPRNTPGTPKDHPRAPRHRSRAPNPSQRTPKDHPGAPRHRSRAPRRPQGPPRSTQESLLLPSLLTPPSLLPVPSSLPPPSSLPLPSSLLPPCSLGNLSSTIFGQPICAPILAIPTGGRRHRA